jgi:hypothetical protein
MSILRNLWTLLSSFFLSSHEDHPVSACIPFSRHGFQVSEPRSSSPGTSDSHLVQAFHRFHFIIVSFQALTPWKSPRIPDGTHSGRDHQQTFAGSLTPKETPEITGIRSFQAG